MTIQNVQNEQLHIIEKHATLSMGYRVGTLNIHCRTVKVCLMTMLSR